MRDFSIFAILLTGVFILAFMALIFIQTTGTSSEYKRGYASGFQAAHDIEVQDLIKADKMLTGVIAQQMMFEKSIVETK